jgi:hypothetical protein
MTQISSHAYPFRWIFWEICLWDTPYSWLGLTNTLFGMFLSIGHHNFVSWSMGHRTVSSRQNILNSVCQTKPPTRSAHRQIFLLYLSQKNMFCGLILFASLWRCSYFTFLFIDIWWPRKIRYPCSGVNQCNLLLY